MRNRLVITTAVGLVLATTAYAQSPNSKDQTKQQAPPAATNQPSTTQDQSRQQPSASQAQQPAPANQAQSPAPSTQPSGAAQAPAQTTQPSGTAQAPAQTTQPSGTAQAPAQTTQPSGATGQAPAQTTQPSGGTAQPAQPGTAQAPATQPSGTAAQPGTGANTRLDVNVQQQTQISQSIARMNVRPLTNVNFSVAVGTVIPRSIQLQPLPADIVRVVPQYQGYSFVVVRDEIVIVEPATYKIVAVLPRSGGGTAAAPAPAQKKTVKFTDRERAAIRKHVRTGRERVTTGSTAGVQVRVGERVPETTVLREFPQTIYRSAPSVREYRYFTTEGRSYLVEPRERVIIEEID